MYLCIVQFNEASLQSCQGIVVLYVCLVDVPIISGALISKIEANTDILTLRLIGTDRDHRSAMNLSRFGQSVITGLR